MTIMVRMGACGPARLFRWLGAAVAWGALLLLALAALQPAPAPRPGPAARRPLQSDLAATPPAAEPLLDRRQRDEAELLADAERRMPSLPLLYWNKNKDNKKKFFKNKDCAPFPSIYDVQFDNVYWQTLRTSNGTFHLYGAYYDVRKASLLGPAVRILAVHDRIQPTLTTHCQLWFEDENEPVIVKNLEYKYIWNSKWGNYKHQIFQPYLLACVLPAKYRERRPAAVSLVEKPCDRATNNLRVYFDQPARKKDFAVCVKGLDFEHEDLSVRLVEWIELLGILGAEKIFFYQLQVHPNITKVLDHYERKGRVHVTPITLPGGQPNLPGLQHMYLKKKTSHKRQNELIPYNDCLYKHMYSYKYIALLDVDEVIVPLRDASWSALMERVRTKSTAAPGKPPRSSYHASNVYFLDELSHRHGWLAEAPRHLHMLQHVYRTRNFTKPGQYVKAFHDPERVLTLHNHFPLACLGRACSSYALETGDAQLQHYRADCVRALSATCRQLREDTVMDNSVWRFKEPLVERAQDTLRQLGFIGPDAR